MCLTSVLLLKNVSNDDFDNIGPFCELYVADILHYQWKIAVDQKNNIDQTLLWYHG